MEKFYFNGQPVAVEYLNQIIIRFVKTKSPYSQKSVQQDLVQDIWCLILQTWRKTLLLDNDILNHLI